MILRLKPPPPEPEEEEEEEEEAAPMPVAARRPKRGAAAEDAAEEAPKAKRGKPAAPAPKPKRGRPPKAASQEAEDDDASSAASKRPKRGEPAAAPSPPASQASEPRRRGRPPKGAASPPKSPRADKVRVLFTGVDVGAREQKCLRDMRAEQGTPRTATHVVTAPELKRTMKLLAAVSVADHVVSADWLYACGKAKAKVDEAAYAVVDAAREKEWRFSLAASLAANARGVKVLAGYAVAVAPGAHDVAKLPANPDLKDMVECAGGAFLRAPPTTPPEGSWPKGLLLVGLPELLVESSKSRAASKCLAALGNLQPATVAAVLEPAALYSTILAKKLDPKRCLKVPKSLKGKCL